VRSRFFRLPFFIFLCGVFILLYAVLFYATHVSEQDQEAYDMLAKEILEKHLARKMGEEKEVTKQVREQVKKTFFFTSGSQRLEIELQGVQSEIGVFQKKSDARLIESYTDAICFIQEELFYVFADGKEAVLVQDGYVPEDKLDALPVAVNVLLPKQRIRYLEADLAIYDFHSQILIAYNVSFWTYTVDGHTLPKSVKNLHPLTKGTARSMTMSYGANGELQFSAENLNMEMTDL